MLRKNLVLWVAVISFQWVTHAHAASVDVIPQPQHLVVGAGTFEITTSTHLLIEPNSAEAADAAKVLTDRLLQSAGLTLTATEADGPSTGAILITTKGADAALGDEGYSLDATTQGITIRAPHSAGLFYGVQTLLQLLPPDIYASTPAKGIAWTVPAVQITDVPRFKWRGLLLDVARHYESKPVVLRFLDELAMHKLNVFHWHLTDDQGWRLEIKQYPKLTSIGAWRDKAGFGLDPKLSTTYGPDGKYGGFYTQDDVREVIKYAAARHILVVPEIEMPGHASAARRAYPEYFIPEAPVDPAKVKGDAGVFNGIYEPANEQTFTFLQNVLGEVIDLFPSPFIHIGGDEVPKVPWQNNPADVDFMKRQHLAGADELQSYFIQRIGKFISSKGRRMIGWDEILQGGLGPDATVMSWHGNDGGLAAARADHDVVMTAFRFTYLDFESSHGLEPHELGGYLMTKKAYLYEPVSEGLPASMVHHVLGLQGCLWGEYVPNSSIAEYLAWPREAALAEVAWTPVSERNWESFARRLPVEQKRLDAMGVNYRPIENDELKNVIHLSQGNGSQLVIENPYPGSTIHYTLNADYPWSDSPVYTTPVALPDGWVTVAARYVTPGKVAAPATSATFLDGRAVRINLTVPNDWDERKTSFFVPVYPFTAEDWLTISFLGGAQQLHGVTVKTGDPQRPNRELELGVLETSEDGKTYIPAPPFNADGEAHADLEGKPITKIRIRFTGKQQPIPIIESVQLQ